MQSTLKVESVQRCFCFRIFGSGFLVTVFAFKVLKSKHKTVSKSNEETVNARVKLTGMGMPGRAYNVGAWHTRV